MPSASTSNTFWMVSRSAWRPTRSGHPRRAPHGVPIISILEGKNGKKPGDMLLLASTGMPVSLDFVRSGWQQVEVEQPLYAQIYGLAMFTPKILKGREARAGCLRRHRAEIRADHRRLGPESEDPGRSDHQG